MTKKKVKNLRKKGGIGLKTGVDFVKITILSHGQAAIRPPADGKDAGSSFGIGKTVLLLLR